MKKKRIWLWIGAVISGFLFGMVSVALKGVLITISMESVFIYYLLPFAICRSCLSRYHPLLS